MNAPITIAADGAVWLGGELLHPAQGALAAAQRDLRKLLSTATPEDLLILAGAGLGWHAAAATARRPGPAVLVYEPDPQVRALLKCLGPELGSIEMCTDQGELLEALSKHLVYRESRRAAVFSSEADRLARPHLLAEAKENLAATLERKSVDQGTRRHLWRGWTEHLTTNIKRSLQHPDLTLLRDAFAGVPAVVVGAGPSLDQSLEHIRAAQQAGAMVLAAASALKPLAAAGVTPELAVALEAKDESRQFPEPEGQGATLLALASQCHPNHFQRWQGSLAVFHMQSWLPRLFGQGLVLPTGGHATSAAFSLAVLWGADPIMLVGQDLAYTDGRVHAAGRPGGQENSDASLKAVAALDGGEAMTTAAMDSYIEWYKETASYLHRTRPGTGLYNATAAGARLEGFAEIPGNQMASLARHYNGNRPDLLEAVRGLPLPDVALVERRLNRERDLLRQALGRLDSEADTAWLDDLPEGSAARWLLREALAGADRAEMGTAALKFFGMMRDMREALYAD